MIGVRATRMVIPTVFVGIALLSLYNFLGPVGRTVVIVFGIYFLWTRLNQLFYDYYTTFWRVRSNELHIKGGLFVKTSTRVPFSSIIGVSSNQGRYERLFGVHRIVIETRAAQGVDIILDAVRDSPGVRAIEAYLGETDRGEEVSRDTDRDTPQDAVDDRGITLSTISAKRLLSVSLTYGKYILFLPLALNIVSRISGIEPWQLIGEADGLMSQGNVPIILLAVVTLLALSFGYGYLLSLLKFGKLRVSADSGELRVQRGILTRWDEKIHLEHVDALKIRQNVLMRLGGLYEVRASIRGSTDESRQHVVSPALNREELAHVFGTYLPGWRIPERDLLKPSSLGYVVNVLQRFCVIAVITLLIIWLAPTYYFGIGFATGLLCLHLLNSAYRRIGVSSETGHVNVVQGLVYRSVWLIPRGSLCSQRVTAVRFIPTHKFLHVVFRGGGSLPKRKTVTIKNFSDASII